MKGTTFSALRASYATQGTNPVAVVEHGLARIAAEDPDGSAVVELTRQRALAAAAGSAARWRDRRPLGPLDGIPLVWKDVFDLAGTTTRCGSATRAMAPAASMDAALVQRLESFGMISLGKAAMSELAYSALGINALTGTPRNPWDKRIARVPGGSSSGSGVAVARDWVPCGMGSDTSGSIRVPAALLGLVGFKPSHGRYPVSGMFPLARSLDVPGPLVRDVVDAMWIDAALVGEPAYRATSLRDWRFVVPQGAALAAPSAEVADVFAALLTLLRRAEATLVEREFEPFEATRQLFDRFGTLVAVESSEVHRELLQSQDLSLVDPRISQRMRLGAALPPENATAIRQARASLIARTAADLAENEVLLYPTVCRTAPEQAPLDADAGLFASCNLQLLQNTMPGSYLDMPTLNLPVGLAHSGLPVGVSLSVTSGRDCALLALGLAVQGMLDEAVSVRLTVP